MTKIHFKTYGCAVNFSETEVMKGLLSKAEFSIVSKGKNADVIVINVCTVKGITSALRHIRKAVEKFPNKKIMAAGCLTKSLIKEIGKLNSDINLINTYNINSIVEVVEEVINDNTVELLAPNNIVKLNFPKIRKNKIIGIVPISSGCLNTCAYCSVRLVKGKLNVYPMDKIVEEVKKCLKDGCKEIWITSQDNAQYPDLPELLRKVVSIPGDFKVRVGMMNPNGVLKILDDLIEVFRNDKMFKFLHIPVQSGNDLILKRMRRDYTVEDFKKIVEKFRQEIPSITIATDIIVGFPSETDKQFSDSLSLVREIKPAVLNRSRFQPRPGTLAASMDEQVVSRIAKDRSRMLTSIFTNISRMQNERWIGWNGVVLVDEKGKQATTWIGRNFAYKPVILKGSYELGEKVNVKIRKVSCFDLRA